MKLKNCIFFVLISFISWLSAANQTVVHNEFIVGTNSNGNEISGVAKNKTTIIHNDNNDWSGPELREAVNGLTNGGKVYITGGHYKVGYSSGGVVDLIGKENIEFIGDGDATILESGYASNGSLVQKIFYLQNSKNISFKNIKFKGLILSDSKLNQNNGYHGAIQVDGNSTNISFENCTFEGFYTGAIEIKGSSNNVSVIGNDFIKVSNNPASGAHYGAIMINSGTKDILISQNYFFDAKHSGISGINTKHLTISDNTIYLYPNSNYTMGLYFLDGLSSSTISSNRIYNSENEGIVLSGGTNNVSNNIITGNIMTAEFTGITINLSSSSPSSYNNIVSNNQISSFGSHSLDHGILTFRSEQNQFISNNISNAVRGINLQKNPLANSLSSNIIDASSYGIVLYGSSVATGNQIFNASRGIYCNYVNSSYRSIISNNLFSNVSTPYSKGGDSAGCKESGNYNY